MAAMFAVACFASCRNGTKPSEEPHALPEAGPARFVKFEELTEWSGKPWAAMAEFNLVDATGATVDRSHWTISADSSGDSDAAKNAIDGNPATHWHSRWETDPAPPPPHWIVVGLGRSVRLSGFRYLPRQDGSANGSIAKFRFYISQDGVTWGEPVAQGDLSAKGTATEEKTVEFAARSENRAPTVTTPAGQTTVMGERVSLQVAASDADGDELIFSARGLPQGLDIDPTTGSVSGTPVVPGSYDVVVDVSDGKATPVSASFHWTVGDPPTKSAAPLAPGQVRFVKFEAASEINGNAWASMAEFNLVGADGHNLPRTGWTALADSSDVSDQPVNAIDDNPHSIWHTRWSGGSPPMPHAFIVDLGQGAIVRGFKYLPRQDGITNGIVNKFRFFTSANGIDWGKPLVEGEFSKMGPQAAEKTVMLR